MGTAGLEKPNSSADVDPVDQKQPELAVHIAWVEAILHTVVAVHVLFPYTHGLVTHAQFALSLQEGPSKAIAGHGSLAIVHLSRLLSQLQVAEGHVDWSVYWEQTDMHVV